MRNAEEYGGKGSERPAVEWIFGLMSGCGVLALMAYLGYQALFSSSRPPELVVSVIGVEQADGASIATFEIANHGDRAAAAVSVLAGTKVSETAWRRVEFDYVAPRSVRRGAIAFPAAILSGDVGIEIGGYTEP
ncbi:hypothetical protein [Paracoccus siganidrum]|nr:hypothetical protein [Paracoccus siganidrum]